MTDSPWVLSVTHQALDNSINDRAGLSREIAMRSNTVIGAFEPSPQSFVGWPMVVEDAAEAAWLR